MSKRCNGVGCNGAWDCDNCRSTNGCDKAVECDICGNDCGETYYRIENDDICEECLNEIYKRSVDY